MNPTILNREFKHPKDGWYHLEPKGEHLNKKANLVQAIDDEACAAIVNRFNQAADAGQLSHGAEMLIDVEHFKHQSDKETRAYGWLQRLQNRDDGVYGQIRWTSTGKAAVDGGDYRFFSTEYNPEDLVVLNRDGNKVRPTRLAGLTLTNCPNNKGAHPITNSSRQNAASSSAGEQADIQNRQNSMKQIATRLGLSADASEGAILAELDKLENRAKTAESELTPLKTERDTLKNRVATLEDEQADALLDAHGIKKDDADRPQLKAGLIANRETGLAFLKRIAPAGAQQQQQAKAPLTNRETAKVPTGTPSGKTDAQVETAKATAILNRANELVKTTPNLTQASAVIMAQRELANS